MSPLSTDTLNPPSTSLSPDEAAHAASILDPYPELRPIPPERITRILVAVPVRKPPEVLAQLLQTLAWQRLRIKAEITYLFAPNFGAEPHRDAALGVLRSVSGAIVWPNLEAPEGDYGERSETRMWTSSAFGRMATLKNRMLQYAMDHAFDFVWLLDADVMCDPGTLQSMLDTSNHDQWLLDEMLRMPIVSAVYWTRWQRQQPDSVESVHAGPQVWLRHPYHLDGRGWTEGEFRRALVTRQRVEVGGLGACTLIPVSALRHGVSFARFDGLPPGPMSEGEDRHFCAWATAKHVPLIADAWPDIWHAFHPQEYTQLPQRVAALDYAVRGAQWGDMVSARIEMLEPINDEYGRRFVGLHRWIRGSLGALPVLPQIEETLAMLHVGQSKVTRLHFPSGWPLANLATRSVVARVTLFDVKPWRLHPVIDVEHFVGQRSRALIDATQHTLTQLDELAHG